MSITEVNLANYQAEISKSEKPVLLDFYADWCLPCKAVGAELEALADEYDKVKFCRMDAEKNADIAMIYGIISVPVLVLIKDGREVARKLGSCERQDIIDFVEENMG
ncbi:MAG: redoxin domain-containing protein [Ruminococcaceae bacterium]|nr:redoxin domain-containing protein [Oscillospiraceae bacterium]